VESGLSLDFAKSCEAEFKVLSKKYHDQEQEIIDLKARLNQDSSNSNFPSSNDKTKFKKCKKKSLKSQECRICKRIR
jgi:hypothetical protein